MSDLREALEAIARGATPIGISPAKWAEEWLAAHPVEPAPMTEEEIDASQAEAQRNFQKWEPVPAQVEITDEAAAKAGEMLWNLHAQTRGWDDLIPLEQEQMILEAREVVAAAPPYLVPRPLPTLEQMTQVIEDTTREHLWDKTPGSTEDAFEFEPVAPKVAAAVLSLLGGES